MTFVTWNPWREMEALRREVERAFENFEARPGDGLRGPVLTERFARSYPFINLSEDKDNFYVEALAPGVNPDSLEISIGPARGLGNTIRIAGEKQAIRMDVKPEAYHRNERQAGKFIRTVTLPVEVDGEKVSADYANGILTVKLAKAEAAKPKKIEVKVA